MRRVMMVAGVISVLLALSAVPVVAGANHTGTAGEACHVVAGPNKGKSGTYQRDGDCCGAWGCTDCTHRGRSTGKCEDGPRTGGTHDLLNRLLATQATILAEQARTTAALTGIRAEILDLRILVDDARSACAPPDLIPVAEANFPQFCHGDSNGNLIVKVRNQGMSEAAASTLRVTFTTPTGPVVVDVPTPVLTWGGGTADLAVPIPSNCFGPFPPATTIDACNFQIAVDALGVVAESNEPNNNVPGACIAIL